MRVEDRVDNKTDKISVSRTLVFNLPNQMLDSLETTSEGELQHTASYQMHSRIIFMIVSVLITKEVLAAPPSAIQNLNDKQLI